MSDLHSGAQGAAIFFSISHRLSIVELRPSFSLFTGRVVSLRSYHSAGKLLSDIADQVLS